jgi:CBS domain-containing protein
VSAILEDKGDEVFTVAPGAVVLEAVRLMDALAVGSLLVVDGNRAVGILSAADVLSRVIAARRPCEETLVSEVMTIDMPAIAPATPIEVAMSIMTRTRRRHLPVIRQEDGEIVGLVSIGDLTKWLISDKSARIRDLINYVVRP